MAVKDDTIQNVNSHFTFYYKNKNGCRSKDYTTL